jgi:bifunctional non-homologous end joining protein LigD
MRSNNGKDIRVVSRITDYRPQLATLVKDAPLGDEWLHELKYDGYRIGARVRNGRVALYSRNGKDWTGAFPRVVEGVAALGVSDALLDGEVAMVLPDGRTSFQALQNMLSSESSGAVLAYFVFDLLRIEGDRLESLPLEERKARLLKLVGRRKTAPVRYSDHVIGRGDEFFKQACRAGLEGIISKRRDQPHHPGRHRDWLKTKCVLRQEFVIGGFTDPEGSRQGIGALLAGYYEGDRLTFAGKVGTGFTHQGALDLRRRLGAVEVKASPFTPPPAGVLARRAHWVKPAFVCELAFTEWTGDGKIRHPSFQGLRPDKSPKQVVRERPVAFAEIPTARTTSRKRHTRSRRSARSDDDSEPAVAGVRISNPDRVIFATPRLTKLGLARYYDSIGEWIVPHVAGRPLTLVRCPDAVSKGCFFMKHSKVWAPSTLRRVRIQEKSKLGEYLIADDLPGVIGLVQMGIVEVHTWDSTYDHLEHPNRIVFDLDPGDRVTWPRVVDAARTVRRALAALDLEAYVKTTGGRGLHIVVPLVPYADWTECLAFARALGGRLEQANPGEYTTVFAKSGRENKILIDYLRNNRTNTSIAAFSTRAREGAPVSFPITWEELKRSLEPPTITAATTLPRLARRRSDPWKSYWTSRQKLTSQRMRAIRRQ